MLMLTHRCREYRFAAAGISDFFEYYLDTHADVLDDFRQREIHIRRVPALGHTDRNGCAAALEISASFAPWPSTPVSPRPISYASRIDREIIDSQPC